MAEFHYFIPSSNSNGIAIQQFAAELNAAWNDPTPSIDFVVTADIASEDNFGTMKAGILHVITVETPDSGQESTLTDTVANHVPTYPTPWELTIFEPWKPDVGDVVYFSNISREGSGSGALAWWDGSQWLRVSDNAVATVPA